jgi:hypothetical protein
MNKGISLALLLVGAVLLVLGMKATEAFDSEVSQFFTGAPTDKAIWLLIGGIVATVVGLCGVLRKSA